MLVLGFDTETTGLDTSRDLIIQVGAVLWDTEARIKKSKIKLDALLSHPDMPLMEEKVVEIHGITPEDIQLWGQPAEVVFCSVISLMKVADALVAHNGNLFDKPIFEQNCKRYNLTVPEKLWIDTSCDIEYPPHIGTRRLSHLAAEHGFLNPFAHDASSDVLTMLRIADQYDWQKTVEWAKSPSVVIKANTNFNQKELAKKQNFRWDNANKQWIKTIKAFQMTDCEREAREAGFTIQMIPKG